MPIDFLIVEFQSAFLYLIAISRRKYFEESEKNEVLCKRSSGIAFGESLACGICVHKIEKKLLEVFFCCGQSEENMLE